MDIFEEDYVFQDDPGTASEEEITLEDEYDGDDEPLEGNYPAPRGLFTVKREFRHSWRGVRSCKKRGPDEVRRAYYAWIERIKAEFNQFPYRESKLVAKWGYKNGRRRWSRKRYCNGWATLNCVAYFEIPGDCDQ